MQAETRGKHKTTIGGRDEKKKHETGAKVRKGKYHHCGWRPKYRRETQSSRVRRRRHALDLRRARPLAAPFRRPHLLALEDRV